MQAINWLAVLTAAVSIFVLGGLSKGDGQATLRYRQLQ